LSRFISRLGEKAIPLYQLLKKTDDFKWTKAAAEAFEALKKQLAEPPILAAPITKELMLLYIAANNKAVSVAMVVERKEASREYPVQRPVYYVSEVLTLSKQRYPHWQKLVFEVFMASRKLRHYFLKHPITVVSSAPLGDIIITGKLQGELQSGPLNLDPIISNMCLARP
jgi:hypothetical protein